MVGLLRFVRFRVLGNSHSCVQRLIEAGFDLKAIGDFVGHRLPESTQIYSKVSVEKLREVALARGEGAL